MGGSCGGGGDWKNLPEVLVTWLGGGKARHLVFRRLVGSVRGHCSGTLCLSYCYSPCYSLVIVSGTLLLLVLYVLLFLNDSLLLGAFRIIMYVYIILYILYTVVKGKTYGRVGLDGMSGMCLFVDDVRTWSNQRLE